MSELILRNFYLAIAAFWIISTFAIVKFMKGTKK